MVNWPYRSIGVWPAPRFPRNSGNKLQSPTPSAEGEGEWPSFHSHHWKCCKFMVALNSEMGLSENSVPLHPMVNLTIIIPTKWL